MPVGDSVEDEWFVVWLLVHLSRRRDFAGVAFRVWDDDGEFLLIEAADHLPRWLQGPGAAANRVFVFRGQLHLVPPEQKPPEALALPDALRRLAGPGRTAAGRRVQLQIEHRIREYPGKARADMHVAHCAVPRRVASLLRAEPQLVAAAVAAFSGRGPDDLRAARALEHFPPAAEAEAGLTVAAVTFSRCLYAQLALPAFAGPPGWPLPPRSHPTFARAELGMKLTCGLEMAVARGAGAWRAYRGALEARGYFEGHLPGSREHRRLLDAAAAAFRADGEAAGEWDWDWEELLGRVGAGRDPGGGAAEGGGEGLPPEDDAGWLDEGEALLSAAMRERAGAGEAAAAEEPPDALLDSLARGMRAFVEQQASHAGAEVPAGPRPFDPDYAGVFRELKEALALGGHEAFEEISSGAPSESDFSDDATDSESESSGDGGGAAWTAGAPAGLYFNQAAQEIGSDSDDEEFDDRYAAALAEQLAGTKVAPGGEGRAAGAADADDGGLKPVDVDLGVVSNLLASVESQDGLPGPAGNLLGLMGVTLPGSGGAERPSPGPS